MKLARTKVVVVGGAVAGASAALLLARAGARVTLLEREPAARPAGAGIALAENGLAVLDGLGIDLSRSSASLHGVRVVDARARTLFTPTSHQPGRAPIVRMARRSALYALLLDALTREPNIELRHGTCFTRLDELDADLVIGADGAHSRVREEAGIPHRVTRSRIQYARALVPGQAENVEAWTAAGLFGSFMVPDGCYWFASLGEPRVRTAIARRDLPALAEAWGAVYAPSRALIRALPSFDALLINDVVHVECKRFVRGRVALLGDAAHAMAPNLGQGANSALVDAAVLCDALRTEPDLASALQAYDARRRPAVCKVARTAARLGKLAELRHPALRWLRDRVLMPLAARADGHAAARLTLQEDPDVLRALSSR